MNLKRILKISRPRFWFYEAGTFLIGFMLAAPLISISNMLHFALWFLYFLIPANILIYGINDIFDYETDLKNPKKGSYEELLIPSEHKKVFKWILLTNLPFLLIVFWYSNFQIIFWFFAFIFFAYFYSAKPIRAKTKPVLDSFFSASHYISTGVFAYVLFSLQDPNWIIILAGILWAMAMHAYSAIPDINADKDAGLETIATKLGFRKTIDLCIIFYTCAFSIAAFYLNFLFILLLIPYLYLMFITLKKPQNIFKYYKIFPTLNTITGFILFLSIFLLKFF
jgi:lycopene elongase/hydratase (dihydrobisanhydrobacterioruberin-forming)